MDIVCATCKCWKMNSVAGQPGECRKGPPTVFMLIQPAQQVGRIQIEGKQVVQQPNLVFITKWPSVPAAEYCHAWVENIDSPAVV
jgi:hypothetical protein